MKKFQSLGFYNYILPLLFWFFFHSCADTAIEEPCAQGVPTEGFGGEVIFLESCNENMSSYSWTLAASNNSIVNGAFLGSKKGNLVLPIEAGSYTIILRVTSNKGSSEKRFPLVIKAGGKLIADETGAISRELRVVSLPNGNLMLFGLLDQTRTKSNIWLFDKNFAKLTSSGIDPSKPELVLNDVKPLLTPEGVLMCGLNPSSGDIDTYLYDNSGNIIRAKEKFPSNSISGSTFSPALLLNGIQNDVILVVYRKVNGRITDNILFNIAGQTIVWSTTIRSIVKDVVIVNGQYNVLSVDFNRRQFFNTIIDNQGVMLAQKQVGSGIIDGNDNFKITSSDNEYIIAASATTGYANNSYFIWLDYYFDLKKTVTIGAPMFSNLFEVSSGYVFFDGSQAMIRFNSGGYIQPSVLLPKCDFQDLIKDTSGNFVLVSTVLQPNSSGRLIQYMRLIRISPDGRVL